MRLHTRVKASEWGIVVLLGFNCERRKTRYAHAPRLVAVVCNRQHLSRTGSTHNLHNTEANVVVVFD